MIAGRLTHRARVERNVAVGEDAWGGEPAPDYELLHDALPCFAWSSSSRELVDGSKTANIEDLRAMFALGADIREGDEIVAISDRAGNAIVAGRLTVEGPVQHKHNHLEAALQRIG